MEHILLMVDQSTSLLQEGWGRFEKEAQRQSCDDVELQVRCPL
jgi:hypothetical protein